MAELTLNTDDITSALRSNLADWSPSLESETMGYVTSVGDGVARVTGLPKAMASELLEFPGGLLGVALNLDEDSIGAVIMGDASGVEEGDEVRSTGRVLSIPVGDALLGRVVNPLGIPIDGKGDLGTTERRLLETQAPSVVQRQPVSEPLQTGIKAIDAMTPIGRGQRQLIIGDRQTGKTAIVVDTILAQKGLGVKCIYVAIGQKNSTVAEVVDILERNGAMEYSVVVNASAGDSAALQMYAPYAGSAIGQHWMYNGQHALVIFDDLTKQAVAYREISLLLRRPPGREAYPGDVFYLHSRLLERCAKLSELVGE
ncbi:MAG: F0F1 ATP synthase subunit alpha, partial [Acidimicrobiia bacterium]